MTGARRSLAGRLLLGLNVLAANIAAATCVIVFVNPSAVGLSPPGIPAVMLDLRCSAAWLVFVCALALLVLNGWYLLRRRPAASEQIDYVVSETGSGALRIAREALETGLRAAGEALPQITRLRVAVSSAGARRVLVRGWFQCAEGVSNLQASQDLRRVLAERFHTMVQLGDGGRVDYDLEFGGFSGKLPGKAAAGPAEPEPFTGPKYPIDDEPAGGGS